MPILQGSHLLGKTSTTTISISLVIQINIAHSAKQKWSFIRIKSLKIHALQRRNNSEMLKIEGRIKIDQVIQGKHNSKVAISTS